MVGGMIDISLHWQAGQQYRSLFTEHPQPMWVCDQGSLRLLAVNPAMARHYGYDEQELLGMDMRLLWPQAQRAQADSALAMCSDARAAHTLATAGQSRRREKCVCLWMVNAWLNETSAIKPLLAISIAPKAKRPPTM